MPAPGRRPGNPETQAEIVAAARLVFAQHGYDASSVRQIADIAGVDPALVYHYFKDKAALFAASIEIPFDPRQAITHALEDDPSRGGENLVRLLLTIWELDEPRAAFLGMLRSTLGGNDHALGVIREAIVGTVTESLGRVSPGQDVEMRALGIVSQLIGMAVVRYVARLEPLASASTEEIVAMVGPRIQGYIDG